TRDHRADAPPLHHRPPSDERGHAGRERRLGQRTATKKHAQPLIYDEQNRSLVGLGHAGPAKLAAGGLFRAQRAARVPRVVCVAERHQLLEFDERSPLDRRPPHVILPHSSSPHDHFPMITTRARVSRAGGRVLVLPSTTDAHGVSFDVRTTPTRRSAPAPQFVVTGLPAPSQPLLRPEPHVWRERAPASSPLAIA